MEHIEEYLKYCTPRVKKMFLDAVEIGKAEKLASIGPEHILLAMLQSKPSQAQQALQNAGVTYEAVHKLIVQEQTDEGKGATPATPAFTADVAKMLKFAIREAKAIHYSYVGMEQILLGMFFINQGQIAEIFNQLQIDKSEIRNEILKDLDSSYLPLGQGTIEDIIETRDSERDGEPKAEKAQGEASSPDGAQEQPSRKGRREARQSTLKPQKEQPMQRSLLDHYGKDLTELAKQSMFDPVIGRENEIQRITQVLSRKIKNNVVLLGEAGVGKTAIVEGLAMNIAAGKVPEVLRNKHIFSLDVTLLIAGTQYRGMFEDRMAKILAELKKSNKYILFLDEIHTIVGAGSGREDGLDISNIIKPALSRGEIQCIGATTIKEYRNTIEKNQALERRFQTVMVGEPTPEDAVKILKGIAQSYETFHKVKYSDEVLEAAVFLSVRYLPARQLPDKAIDIIDETGAMVRLRESSKDENLGKEPAIVNIGLDDIRSVVSKMSGVPLEKMNVEERKRMLEIGKELSKTVIGQESAVNALSNALKRSRAELGDPRRPIGSFLFVGPSGVGKSLMAKALADFMFNDREALIRLDMSEYADGYNVSKLLGSSPGYVGYGEGGHLTEKVRRKPYSVVLFDEIEKAHPQVINILLQLLEEGQLTDEQGNCISFRNTIIIMTSNLGSEKGAGLHTLGFGEQSPDNENEKLQEQSMKSVKSFFRPEVLNRIDEIVFFRQLNEDDLKAIARLEIDKLEKRLERINGKLDVADDVFDAIMERAKAKEGGARLIRRAVEELLENRLADELLKEEQSNRPFIAHITKNSVTIE